MSSRTASVLYPRIVYTAPDEMAFVESHMDCPSSSSSRKHHQIIINVHKIMRWIDKEKTILYELCYLSWDLLQSWARAEDEKVEARDPFFRANKTICMLWSFQRGSSFASISTLDYRNVRYWYKLNGNEIKTYANWREGFWNLRLNIFEKRWFNITAATTIAVISVICLKFSI